MTYVVAEGCILCKHTDCVDVCPVDCFVEGPNFLAINPDVCIDCAVCVPEMPSMLRMTFQKIKKSLFKSMLNCLDYSRPLPNPKNPYPKLKNGPVLPINYNT